MFGYLIHIEQIKLFKRLMFWVEMGLLCGFFLLLYYVGSVVASSPARCFSGSIQLVAHIHRYVAQSADRYPDAGA